MNGLALELSGPLIETERNVFTQPQDPVVAEFEYETGLPAPEADLANLERAEPSLQERIGDYINKINALGHLSTFRERATAGIAAFSIAGVGVAETASVAVANTSNLEARAAASDWVHLGGDPLQRNVNTRNKLVHLITSKKGGTAMKFAGLNTAQRKDVKLQVRQGNFRQCHMKFGEKFAKMSFGINGTSVDSDVTFKDPHFRHKSANAWCINFDGMQMKVPFACGNIALKNLIKHGVNTPVKKPGECNGDTTNNTVGSTGTAQGGNCSVNTVVDICTANKSPNAIVCSPQTPQPPVTPPPPPVVRVNHPPTITINNPPQHTFTNGQIENCVTTFDPDGDSLLTKAAAGQGTVSAPRQDPTNPNITCVTYTAPGFAGSDQITWTTQDNKDANGNPDNVVDATASTPPITIVSVPF